MEELVRLINELQDARTELHSANISNLGFSLDFQLPQIAVVGSQSCGKSSVLENFVGRDFLPRGTGIVTRRPLILQLIRNEETAVDYGVFAHQNGEQIRDFNEIRNEICRETNRVTGTNKGISGVPIGLKVFSPNVVDLTLVDLPGLTKVPVGDQPSDIDVQIREMVQTYVANDNCLILALSAANSDLANSDALKLAREVDPEGIRTIGVITKLDLMDSGTDAREVLDNKVYPLRHGYIGVINRSQKDIDTNKDIHSAMQHEKRFLMAHPAYRDIQEKLGTPYLRKVLQAHLVRHIVASIPTLRSKLSSQIVSLEKAIGDLKFEFDYSDPTWKVQALMLKLVEFSQAFQNEVLGNYEVGTTLFDFANVGSELSNGSDIRHLFHAKYPLELAGVQFTDESIIKNEIAVAIQNLGGVRVQIFTPDEAFLHVVRSQIFKMQKPIFALLDGVSEKVLHGLSKTISSGLARFPELQRFLENMCSGYILLQVEHTRAQISTLLECERAYINAKHEDFIGFRFENYQNPKSVRNLRKDPSRQIIHRGLLAVSGSFFKVGRTYFWFVLTCEALSWYQSESEREREYSVGINEDIKRIDIGEKSVSLIDKKGRNIWKNCPSLELTASTVEEMDEWKVKLLNLGVYPAESVESAFKVDQTTDEDFNAHLRKQSEEVWKLVHSYLRIVRSNLCNMVPKIIVHSLIKKSVLYFQTKLILECTQGDRAETLMQENEQDVARRSSLEKMRTTCKKVLDSLEICHIPTEFKDLVNSKPLPPGANLPPVPPRPSPPVRIKGSNPVTRGSKNRLSSISNQSRTSSSSLDSSAVHRKQSASSINKLLKPGQNKAAFYISE